MSKLQTVDYRTENGVATIVLNRPEALNAFNTQLRKDLLTAVTQANTDAAVRVVIITGAGRGFSAGADLKAGLGHDETIEDQLLKEYKPFLMAINDSDKLFISAINGPCAGIGCALAMVCDLTVMADDAYIYLAFAAIGLVPDGGITWQLVNAVGYKRALQIIVEAAKIPAGQCLDYGLANKVVAANELLARTQDWAETLARGAPLAQKFSKQLLKSVVGLGLSESIDLEASVQSTTFSSRDSQHAVQAFFNKQVPKFIGQ